MINKTKLVSDFLKQNILPDGMSKFSKKKSAEILFARHPDLFKHSHQVRGIINSITGASGKKTTIRMKEEHKIKWKGVSLPKPEKNDYSKVIVNEKRIGILSDIHIPYHDEAALNAAIKYLIKWQPECLIINGDGIDMYHNSDFETDPRQRNPKYEFDCLKTFISDLQKAFPKSRIIYKLGNHCERYERQVMKRLPQFIELEWMSFEFALNFGLPKKIEVVKNKRIIKAGHLNILHGHEFAKGFIAPVNVARGFYLRSKANTIAGHHHRISSHSERDINGKVVGVWSTGCLCELNPQYMPINNWDHGFATVEVIDDEGNFNVNNIRIIDGKIV